MGRDLTNGALFFSAAAFAVLCKGPLGVLVPLVTAVVHALLSRRLGRLLRPGFLSPVLLFALLVAAWVVPACMAGGADYTNELLFKQSAGRVFNAWNHEHGFFYYFGKLPLEFMPWTPLLLLSFYLLLRRSLTGRQEAVRLLMSWFLPVFLFLCVVQSKRGNYLLPIYPPLSILCGIVAAEALAWERALRWIAVGLSMLFLVLAAAVLAAPFVPALEEAGVVGLLPGALLIAVLLAAGGILSLRKRHEGHGTRAFLIQAVTVLLVVPAAGLVAIPAVDHAKSPRNVAMLLKDEAGGGQTFVPCCGVRTEEYRFYSGLDCREVDRDDFVEALRRPDVKVALTRRKDLNKLEGELPESATVLHEGLVGGEDRVILLRVSGG